MNYCEEQYVETLKKENEMLKAQLAEYRRKSLDGVQIKVEVDTTELDKAIEKLHQVSGIATHIDELTGRIVRDISNIDTYAKGGSLTGSGCNQRPQRD